MIVVPSQDANIQHCCRYFCSDVNKDLGLKAKAKDLDSKAKAKTKAKEARIRDIKVKIFAGLLTSFFAVTVL